MIIRTHQDRRGALLLTRPNTLMYGHLALEILMTYLMARRAGATRVRFLVPSEVVNRALLEVRTDGIEVLGPWSASTLPEWKWNVERWWLDRRQALRKAIRLRGMLTDGRFPDWFRDRLVALDVATDRLVGRDTFGQDGPYYRRALMRHEIPAWLPADVEARAWADAARLGITPASRIVTLHSRESGFKVGRETVHGRKDHVRNAHIESYFPAMDELVSRGYTVVRVGDPSMTPVNRPGVVDMATSPLRTELAELLCLMKSVFLLGCESGPYGVVYLTNTPSLIVNCTDPISSLPIRANMLHMLKPVRDRVTGHVLSLQEMVSESYLKHLRDPRRYDYLENSPEDLVDAVREMLTFVTEHPPETDRQLAYKNLVMRTAEELRDRYAYVRKWGPEDGFMGDGRIVDAYVRKYWGEPPAQPRPERARKTESPGPSRFLFVMLHSGFTFYYESTIRALAQRGHSVHVAYAKWVASEQLERLVAEFPGRVTHERLPKRKGDQGLIARQELRSYRDYLRYFDPRYEKATYLRRRVEETMPAWVVARVRQYHRHGATALVAQALAGVEQATPVVESIRTFIAAQKPSAVLVTPLVNIGSEQVDFVRAAQSMGIPTGACIASWDNLTNKGVMRIVPERVFVWNEAQKGEAIELHGVPGDRVVVTGAQNFDHWFTWQPSTTREEYCRRWHLDPARPIVLFLGSTQGIAATEPEFVARWIAGIRASSHQALAGANVLVRPHPKQAERWSAAAGTFPSGPGTALALGDAPVNEDSRSAFFDALYHSRAVVGVNTSAQIEAGIVGRPVYTLLAPEFEETQEGTLHFHHLVNVNGGLLTQAGSVEEHLTQLADAVATPLPADVGRKFVEAFVRPFGLDEPGTPRLVAGIEALAGVRPEPLPAPAAAAVTFCEAFVDARASGELDGPTVARLARTARRGHRRKRARS